MVEGLGAEERYRLEYGGRDEEVERRAESVADFVVGDGMLMLSMMMPSQRWSNGFFAFSLLHNSHLVLLSCLMMSADRTCT